jgi:hypothetical protein
MESRWRIVEMRALKNTSPGKWEVDETDDAVHQTKGARIVGVIVVDRIVCVLVFSVFTVPNHQKDAADSPQNEQKSQT